MARRPSRRRLSNFLLNKSLQMRYVGFVTILSALLCGGLGYLIWQQENRASAQILETVDALCDGLGTQDCQELKQELDDDLSRRDTNLVLQMAGVGIGLVLILFTYLVVMTHKVAGPLYKVSKYFDRMAQGRLGPVYPLRKGDMLQAFYSKFKDMHETLQQRCQRENEVMTQFLHACDQAGVSRDGELGRQLDHFESYCDARDRDLQ